jgi:gamma-glutamyltranspeptidase/glutathione hydrolase
MTPSFIVGKDRVAILGTPGGSRIISMVFLAMLDFFQGNPASHWVALPRWHHQYLPDQLQYEAKAFTPEEISALQKLGHQLILKSPYGNMQAYPLGQNAPNKSPPPPTPAA